MNKLVIDDKTGIVENIIVVNDDEFQLDGKTLLENTVGKIGDTYDFDNKVFIPKPVPSVDPNIAILAARELRYIAEGWKTPYDLIDDILENGNENVKLRRDAIKTELPEV